MRARTAASFCLGLRGVVGLGLGRSRGGGHRRSRTSTCAGACAWLRASANASAGAKQGCRRDGGAEVSKASVHDGKHTSLVPAAILARPKNPIVRAHAATVRVHWTSSLFGGRRGIGCRRRGFLRDPRADAGVAALSAAQAVRLMNQGALVLDLRAKPSFDAGHIGDGAQRAAWRIGIQAESLKKMARQERDYLLRQAGVQRRQRRAHADEARFTKVFQSARRPERLGQGQPAAGQNLVGRQERSEMTPPAVTVYVSDWCPLLPASQGFVWRARMWPSAKSTSKTMRSFASK